MPYLAWVTKSRGRVDTRGASEYGPRIENGFLARYKCKYLSYLRVPVNQATRVRTATTTRSVKDNDEKILCIS